MTTDVEIYVDYVCPYCYLVEGAVEELERARDVTVRIRPFELRPDPVPTLRPEDDYLPAVWRGSVYPMAERLGVDIRLPSISPQPRTESAFVVLQLAQERGLERTYSTAMFEAFFQQDLDIGDDDVIVDVATSVGLDAGEVRAVLQDPRRRDRQRADQDRAVGGVGVSAVPSIFVDGALVGGVPDLRRLTDAVDDAVARRARLASPTLSRGGGS